MTGLRSVGIHIHFRGKKWIQTPSFMMNLRIFILESRVRPNVFKFEMFDLRDFSHTNVGALRFSHPLTHRNNYFFSVPCNSKELSQLSLEILLIRCLLRGHLGGRTKPIGQSYLRPLSFGERSAISPPNFLRLTVPFHNFLA